MTRALADYLPIMQSRMERGDYSATYREPEVTRPVDLCDAHGRLNAAAVGWSRMPLVRANLSGHWLRKKRWNFWNWIAPQFVLSATVADIDYAAFCEVTFTDFDTRQSVSATALQCPGTIALPEHVERSLTFASKAIQYSHINNGGDLTVSVRAAAKGAAIAADFVVTKPPDHESLNIVVPWSARRFQLNSKHNTLPCTGEIRVGGKPYAMRPHECHAVQDFGRGVWPYRSFWNWAVVTGVQDGALVGVNMGGKWTTGTGVNENGLYINGRLYKVMEDLVWSYDPSNWMRPWRVNAPHSGMIDLACEPIVARTSRLSLGLLRTGGVCCFGRWRGTIRFDDNELEVRSLIGWAEEFQHRW
ncbi:MAG TPA: DUF2804 domain-containing protein [Candidatus Margulisiibacteriota bacterium]|nr:DUF2804 domain-containing protein [Candidatus Margulisiibacteriota bacterium]